MKDVYLNSAVPHYSKRKDVREERSSLALRGLLDKLVLKNHLLDVLRRQLAPTKGREQLTEVNIPLKFRVSIPQPLDDCLKNLTLALYWKIISP